MRDAVDVDVGGLCGGVADRANVGACPAVQNGGWVGMTVRRRGEYRDWTLRIVLLNLYCLVRSNTILIYAPEHAVIRDERFALLEGGKSEGVEYSIVMLARWCGGVRDVSSISVSGGCSLRARMWRRKVQAARCGPGVSSSPVRWWRSRTRIGRWK